MLALTALAGAFAAAGVVDGDAHPAAPEGLSFSKPVVAFVYDCETGRMPGTIEIWQEWAKALRLRLPDSFADSLAPDLLIDWDFGFDHETDGEMQLELEGHATWATIPPDVHPLSLRRAFVERLVFSSTMFPADTLQWPPLPGPGEPGSIIYDPKKQIVAWERKWAEMQHQARRPKITPAPVTPPRVEGYLAIPLPFRRIIRRYGDQPANYLPPGAFLVIRIATCDPRRGEYGPPFEYYLVRFHDRVDLLRADGSVASPGYFFVVDRARIPD